MNLFYYLTYENAVNLDEIEDEVSKTSAEAQIVHFGQTPCQLFNAAVSLIINEAPKKGGKKQKKMVGRQTNMPDVRSEDNKCC